MTSLARTWPRAAARAVVATTATTALAVTLLPQQVGGQDASGRDSTVATDRIALTNGGNPVTPGNFRGYAFDQCDAPNQRAMNRWLNRSPFLGVGIYIAGSQRWCREQPNLTPRWVRNQLRQGWKLLPIILGPQASCQPRFPRWGGRSISARPDDNYRVARRQGRREAVGAVEAAQQLGIVRGSTLFYDLEGFDDTKTRCRESAMWFLNAWTWKVRQLGYKSGVYSSAGSGIEMLDRERTHGNRLIPDKIWIARWDGKANTSTSYISEEGWRPGGRVKQYRGGHEETHGGVTINIDSNFASLGRGMFAGRQKERCGGVPVNRKRYLPVKHPATGAPQRVGQIRTLKCWLTITGHYDGDFSGQYNAALRRAIGSWQADNGFRASRNFWIGNWVALLSRGNIHPLKFGSAGADVRRAQRALNAADRSLGLRINGRYTQGLADIVSDYQQRVGMKQRNGILNWATWTNLQRGLWKSR